MKNKLLYLLSISIIHLQSMHHIPSHYMAPGTILEKDKTRPLQDTLLLAIARGDLDAVNNFIAAGIDLNARYSETMNILTILTILPYPYNSNTIVYKRDKYNNTALMYAAEIGKLAIVKKLLESGADPNLQNMQKHTALTLCNKYTNVCEVLLKGKADPNIQAFQGYTVLMYSIMRQDKDQVTLLMEHGADPAICNNYGFSALDYAEEAGPEFVTLLAKPMLSETFPSTKSDKIIAENQPGEKIK